MDVKILIYILSASQVITFIVLLYGYRAIRVLIKAIAQTKAEGIVTMQNMNTVSRYLILHKNNDE